MRLAAAILGTALLAACATATAPAQPIPRTADPLERRAAAATADVARLQSELLALADTALARITAETAPGVLHKDPQIRKFSLDSRLSLGTALIGIVTGPDPVDALLDILTHMTLTAEAMRNEADGKASGSTEVRLLNALELNEADAWKLAERWLPAPARTALRERIAAWPGERRSAAAVSYVRLSDMPRTGTASAEAGEGMIDSLRAAVKQAEHARLFAERGLFLAQRMPYALRWQAEALAYNMVAMDESQRLLNSVGGLTATADAAVREITALPSQLSNERAAALQDLFVRIEHERRATLEQMAQIVQKERSAMLAEAGDTVSAQRKAIVADLVDIAARAEERGRHYGGVLLAIVAVLTVALLLMLFGMLLLYRRLLQRMERHPPH